MTKITGVAAALVVLPPLLVASGCGEAAPMRTTRGTEQQVVAQVGGRTITLAEVDKRALLMDAGSYGGMKLHQALYEARRQTIDSMIGEHLLLAEAKARGTTSETLVQQEVLGKVPAVEESEIEAWYRANPGRVRGAPIEQVRTPIRELLGQERRQAALEAYLSQLKKKTAIRIALEPPRQEVSVAANDPAVGPASAAVQIIEFSDFQ